MEVWDAQQQEIRMEVWQSQQQEQKLSVMNVIENEKLTCFQFRETVVKDHAAAADSFHEQVFIDAKKVLEVLLNLGLIVKSDVVDWIEDYDVGKQPVDEVENENAEANGYGNSLTDEVLSFFKVPTNEPSFSNDTAADDGSDKRFKVKNHLKDEKKYTETAEECYIREKYFMPLPEEQFFSDQSAPPPSGASPRRRHKRRPSGRPTGRPRTAHLYKKEKVLRGCSECGKSFVSMQGLNLHLFNMHQIGRWDARDRYEAVDNAQCDICGDKKFSSKRVLKEHIKRVHDKIKKATCNICGNRFGVTRDCERHIATVHEKERPFACKFCSKTFTASSHKYRHIRVLHADICARTDVPEFVQKEGKKSAAAAAAAAAQDAQKEGKKSSSAAAAPQDAQKEGQKSSAAAPAAQDARAADDEHAQTRTL